VKQETDGGAESRVYALLGPTNTGKTHRAIERMLEFETGMMGLPLRLLAREVYDRVSARLGEQVVALVTGEEKRVPAHPRYWICTVEAMPRELQVEFVAIDEVQLIAHPERGHVFTDRVLSWRGREETWFMGAESTERLLRSWLPGLRVRKLPRLSQLSHLGQSSLRTLPRRSAVVAFSMPQVYELADALRARRGGAAVVLGALSPRVRNAQVALYQAGEVDFLVATDAIGMGLNLDIDHVALAARTKFDGFEVRELESAELSQIVGRAGRYLRDGSFGTLAPEPELPPGLVKQLEQHRFPALKFGFYRNAALDFTHVPALIASLERKPPGPGLYAAPDADDLLVLRVMAKKPEVMALATSVARVRALWDVCRIPNYEKRIPEHQAERLVPLFLQLATEGRLASDYVARELARLGRLEGDIHQLMDRLSAVRTWTYVSHQSGWLEDATSFRSQARALEDQVGDLLHQRLLERFVRDSRAQRPRAQRAAREAALRSPSPFAKLAEHALYGAAERAEENERQAWVEQLVQASFAELALDARGGIAFQGAPVARLVPGPALLRPGVKLLLPEWVAPGNRGRIERRLVAHTRDLVSHLLEPLRLAPSAGAPLRGLFYQLEQGLGTVDARKARPQLDALEPAQRAELRERGIVVGARSVFAQELLTPARRTIRMALRRLLAREPRAFDALSPSDLLLRDLRGLDHDTLLDLGFVPLAQLALRCDVYESLRTRLGQLPPEERAHEVAELLGSDRATSDAVARELTRKKSRRRRLRSPRGSAASR
jgi:ATP-dependent RNA helicase SUPV3L1/SUV3